MENTTIRAEGAQKAYDAGDDRLQPKTYRLGMNFTFVVEVNDDANVIDITPLKVD